MSYWTHLENDYFLVSNQLGVVLENIREDIIKSTGSEVKQSDSIDTPRNVTPQSTKLSPANPASSVSPLPSPLSTSPPTAHSLQILSQTSSSILSAHKCPESEDITLHCIASTSKPNNQLEHLSIQPLKNKKKKKLHILQAVELPQRTQAAVQIVSNPPAPSNGGPIYRFWACRPCGPDGWLALLLTKAGQSRSNTFKQTSLDL